MSPTYVSPWSNFRVERISSHKLSVRGREILGMLAKRGVQLSPGNRLERAVVLTEKANDEYVAGRHIDPHDKLYQRRLIEAFRTQWDALVTMHAIVDRKKAAAAITNELLSAFLAGADLPEDDANRWARNTQFEAYVAAILVLSGLSVKKAEPDFRLLFHSEDVGVAVKRLSSTKPSKLYDRLRKAAHQIKDAGGRGFAAVNLDGWIADLGSDPDSGAVGTLVREQLREGYGQLDRVSERRHLLGVIILANWSRFVFGGERPALEWRAPTQIINFTETDAELAMAEEFFGPARIRLENSLGDVGKLIVAEDALR